MKTPKAGKAKGEAGCTCGCPDCGDPYRTPYGIRKPATGHPRASQGHASKPQTDAEQALDVAVGHIEGMMGGIYTAGDLCGSALSSLERRLRVPGHLVSTHASLVVSLRKVFMAIRAMNNDLTHVTALVTRYRERKAR